MYWSGSSGYTPLGHLYFSMRQRLSTHRFARAISALPILDDRLEDSFALGSRNQIVMGAGKSRPWGGLLSKGPNTGSRKLLQVGDSWGGIKDIGGIQGSGSFFQDIGKSLWGIGSGQPHIAGVDLTGITLSTILQVSIAAAGVYSAGSTFQAGLPQPSAPDVAILDAPGAGYIGIIEGPVSFKIARLRLTTGARSIASFTSAVLVPSKKSIRITFPLASSGQTHWRAFSTQEGFGGVGLSYALRYGIGTSAVLDIPESVVAAGNAGGVARSLEFDYKTGDLVPEVAYIDDYPPPAGTHAVRLENVMTVLGAFADSSAAVTTTNAGTVGACSLTNFYESYKPSHRLYFPEPVVDVKQRPTDSHAYVAHRNSITAIFYVGPRDGPACSVITISPDLGIKKSHNWTQVQGLLYLFPVKGGPVRMLPNGSFDYEFAAPVREAMKAWDPDDTVVGWHPDTMTVVYLNGGEGWSFSLQNNDWSPVCYLADAGVAGSALSCVNSQGELIVTVNNAGAHTAYSWDRGVAVMPITSISHYRKALGRSVRIREVQVAFENERTNDPLIISVHRNLRPTFIRDAVLTNGSNVITSATALFDAAHSGDLLCAFGTNVGGAGVNYLLGLMQFVAANQIQLIVPGTGAPNNANVSLGGVYALLARDIVPYVFNQRGAQHTPFLKEFLTIDAQSYALGFSMLTTVNADSSKSVGQVAFVDVVGNIHGGSHAVTT